MLNFNQTSGSGVFADLRSDFMFKKAFEQKDIMIPFLNDILGTDRIVDIDYRNVEQLGLEQDSAKVYFDLYCHTSDGKDLIVEMQRRSQKYYRERTIFYSTYPVQHQYIEAKTEHEQMYGADSNRPFVFNYRLHPVYIISITDFTLEHEADWQEERFVSEYSLRENLSNEQLCNVLNYIYIELPRFRKALSLHSSTAEKWAFVFNNIARLEAVPEELSEKYFQRLFETAKIANFTADEHKSYLEKQKMKYDYENVLEYVKEQAKEEGLAEGEAKGLAKGEAKGLERGLAEGREEGELKGKRETAKGFLKEGVPIDVVCKVTGLSQEEVRDL